MLIDTGAQISLINQNKVKDPTLINKKNRITISSIHGSENTLGEISTTIKKDNTSIPIQLQVTKNISLKEDGILGYDILGKKAIVDGPKKTVLINSGESYMKFPIEETQERKRQINLLIMEQEILNLSQINYLSNHEINPQYKTNLHTVRSITQEINNSKIKITPLKNE